MDFKDLKLDVEEGNEIDIDPGCQFSLSKIIVKGKGNHIRIGRALLYSRLVINLKGNNKKIEIDDSSKNINSLKIVSIRGDNQEVKIGRNFSLGGLEIQMNDGDESVKIGDDCLFSWGIKIRTSDGHSVVDIATNRAINLPKDVVISNRVWVGEDVRFLKGVRIPEDVIIGAGSVVTKYFDDGDANTIIGGFPAKVIRRGVKWDRKKPSDFNSNQIG